VGVLIMILLIRPLGMHIGIGEKPSPAAAPPVGSRPSRVSLAVPKVFLAIVVVTVIALFIGIDNIGLRTFNLVADASGEPKLLSYQVRPAVPQGWQARFTADFAWAKPLFGDTSTWNRYTLYATGAGNLRTNEPVVADVIDSPDLQSFSAYGVEACYQFHGYSLADVAQVSLAGGITGQAMSYTSQQFGSWSIVYWIVPVKYGTATEYERVVLYVQNSGKGVVVPATTKTDAVTNIAGSLNSADPSQERLMRNRAFLVLFARQVIQQQAKRSQSVATINGSAQ
jgi:hypothetical protein